MRTKILGMIMLMKMKKKMKKDEKNIKCWLFTIKYNRSSLKKKSKG